jgi:hypothetical protein
VEEEEERWGSRAVRSTRTFSLNYYGSFIKLPLMMEAFSFIAFDDGIIVCGVSVKTAGNITSFCGIF